MRPQAPSTPFRLALIAFVLGTAISGARATAQAGDELKVGAEVLSIQTNPLEPYFEVHPDARPKSEIVSTGLWRGYVASFEIAEGRLTLTDVKILRKKEGTESFDTEFVSAMSAVFPGQSRVVADWYTGHLVAPTGELVRYVHMGYASTYDAYRVFTVVAGVVTADRAMSRREFEGFRKAQFEAWKRTPEYAARLAEITRDGEGEIDAEEFLFVYAGAEYMAKVFDEGP